MRTAKVATTNAQMDAALKRAREFATDDRRVAQAEYLSLKNKLNRIGQHMRRNTGVTPDSLVHPKLWAEQIPRPYSRAEENARELYGPSE